MDESQDLRRTDFAADQETDIDQDVDIDLDADDAVASSIITNIDSNEDVDQDIDSNLSDSDDFDLDAAQRSIAEGDFHVDVDVIPRASFEVTQARNRHRGRVLDAAIAEIFGGNARPELSRERRRKIMFAGI